jgi:hypothetical protein
VTARCARDATNDARSVSPRKWGRARSHRRAPEEEAGDSRPSPRGRRASLRQHQAVDAPRRFQGRHADCSIEDVLGNLDDARVSAVILSVGGFLGIGDKLVAIPVSQLKVGSEAKFATDLTKEQLARAPVFDFGKLK